MTCMKNMHKKSHAQCITLQHRKFAKQTYFISITTDFDFVKLFLHHHTQSGVLFKGGG